MARRIPAEIDMRILADIALGILYKDIAKKYGVSPAYVSKLSLGKKVPNIYIPEQKEVTNDNIQTFADDIEALISDVRSRKVVASKVDLVKYVKEQITKAAIEIKVYTEILNNIEGEIK